MSTSLRRLTWLDVVRQEMGHWVDPETCDFILWDRTAFPFASVEHVRASVRDFRDGTQPQPQGES